MKGETSIGGLVRRHKASISMSTGQICTCWQSLHDSATKALDLASVVGMNQAQWTTRCLQPNTGPVAFATHNGFSRESVDRRSHITGMSSFTRTNLRPVKTSSKGNSPHNKSLTLLLLPPENATRGQEEMTASKHTTPSYSTTFSSTKRKGTILC
ncbi:hypothetical protein BaRGS_00010824 [Batillaria attramentaria]|uniref:Uncharacterized protein n=1 Tax=Batillaria attramentaria TaxID=370345 RepID=A0ABD0LFC8_9CAEN